MLWAFYMTFVKKIAAGSDVLKMPEHSTTTVANWTKQIGWQSDIDWFHTPRYRAVYSMHGGRDEDKVADIIECRRSSTLTIYDVSSFGLAASWEYLSFSYNVKDTMVVVISCSSFPGFVKFIVYQTTTKFYPWAIHFKWGKMLFYWNEFILLGIHFVS